MALQNQIYKCNICGNIVEVLHPGGGQLVCCGKPMDLLEEKTEEAGKEKHVPVIENSERGTLVRVGSIPHPMEQGHFIEWIEIIDGMTSCRQRLRPGENPEALFEKAESGLRARIYCNIHGLWQSIKK